MPVYFGFRPRTERPAATSVQINGVTYEPAEPSRVKIYPRVHYFSILGSMWRHLLALLVVVLSYGVSGAYLPADWVGEDPKIPDSLLPIPLTGLAFTLKKGVSFPQAIEETLKERGFSTVSFNKLTVYTKASATRDDFLWVDENVTGVNAISNVPNRFLNPQAFHSLLLLRNLTTSICQTLHTAARGGNRSYDEGKIRAAQTMEKLHHVGNLKMFIDDTMEANLDEVNFPPTSSDGVAPSSWMSFLAAVFRFNTDSRMDPYRGGIVMSDDEDLYPPFIQSGDTTEICSPGIIFKFIPTLANPDPNLITDVLGKYFLKLLGPTFEEQSATLKELKSGIAHLRLTRVGDEYTHLYKCIELSIEAQCGMVPFFSGSRYEGSVVMGGDGFSLVVPGMDEEVEVLSTDDLKHEFATVSTHSQALNDIASKFPDTSRQGVKQCTSMVGLRTLCLSGKFTPDEMEFVIGRAADLWFESSDSWVVNPANIKKSMMIISGSLPLTPEVPISRQCLFSRDPILLGLSVFGERTAPSWSIPNGTLNSLATAPPAPPQNEKGKGAASASGLVSDAKWIMEVRKTDLTNACDDFRLMVAQGGYRTVSSVIGRKQGFLVFGRERMTEFWTEMQAAYRTVNPKFRVEVGEGAISNVKRAAEKGAEENVRGLKKKKV